MGNTAVFVSLNAIVGPSHKAVAASGLFLSMSVGMLTGIALSSALMMQLMQQHLSENLIKLGLTLAERQEVISHPKKQILAAGTNTYCARSFQELQRMWSISTN